MAVIGLLGALYQKNLEPGPSLKKKLRTWASPTEIQNRVSQDQPCVF